MDARFVDGERVVPQPVTSMAAGSRAGPFRGIFGSWGWQSPTKQGCRITFGCVHPSCQGAGKGFARQPGTFDTRTEQPIAADADRECRVPKRAVT